MLQSKCGLQAKSIFIDGAAMVNFNPPHKPITFEAYANDVILPYIKSQANKCSRVDIIFDAYLENSLKSQTRKERGTGSHFRSFNSSFQKCRLKIAKREWKIFHGELSAAVNKY